MLKKLKVQNYALIQNLNIEFNGDFSTLTGETGAGKSILLGALSLVLGARADLTALKNNETKCVVEGLFKIGSYNLQPFFIENDLDYEAETLIRREINTSGKSRAFVNDTPVNLNLLKELANLLIDVHSQHENLELNDNHFQLKVIDAVAQSNGLLSSYKTAYLQFKHIEKELATLQENAKTAAADYDYNLFQYEQLVALKLDTIDQAALETELEVLNNAEEIQSNLSVCFSTLSEDEINTIGQLKIVKHALERIQDFFPLATNLLERLESIAIDLKDIAQESELAAEQVEFNPTRGQYIKETLDKLYEVMHKHQVESVEDLRALEEKYKDKVDQHVNADFEIKGLQNKLEESAKSLKEVGVKLSKQRNQASVPFKQKIIEQLGELGMPSAKFQVAIENNSHFYPDGMDKVMFLFSANKNQPEENISKIASGGEISRLMLSIKAILSESIALPTIIFDEIDTGVSGEIADKMATIMQNMAKNMQVISITHLPQIAARGKNHYKVFKEEDENTVHTRITLLNDNERIDEIARLLSGKDISKEAIENAKSLIKF